MRGLVLAAIVLAFLVGSAVGCRVWEELLGEDEDGLYIIALDGSGLQRLTGEDAGFLGWLDNNVALMRHGEELQALDIASEQARTLLSGRHISAPRLSPDGQRIAYLELRSGRPTALDVMRVDGSDGRILAEGDGLNWFSWSPDSQHLAYNLDPDSKNYVVNVSGAEPPRYVAEGAFPDWAPCERILVDEGIWLYSIDPDGNGRTLLGEIAGRLCDPNGDILALEHHGPPPFVELLAVDGSGSLGTLTNGRLAGGSWSPDGSKLVIFRDDGERTLVIVDLERRAEVALVSTSFEKGTCWGVCWSPDSQWVAFPAAEVTDLVRNERLSDGGDWDLYVARADGSEVRRLVGTPRWERGCGWTPDGTRVTFWQGGPPEDGD
jgi:Tol biopolymer transport system component